MKNDELLHKWINGTISEEELEIFRRRPEFDSLKQLYKVTADLEAPEFDQSAMLSNILKEDKTSTKRAPGRRIALSWIKYGVAATVLLLAGWFWYQQGSNQMIYEVAQGEKLDGELLDGSTFVLNAESTLRYHKERWASERRLKLKGEAFFKVKKGKTFTVETPTGKVQVLGTQFNVRWRDGRLEVTCYSGAVAVYSSAGQEFRLEPGQAVFLRPGQEPERRDLAVGDGPDWINGVSTFKEVPLLVVLKEMERQYKVSFDTLKIETTTMVSCSFPHQNLDEALKIVLNPVGIQYKELKNNKIDLYRE